MIKVDETDPVGELDPSFPYRDVQIKRNTDVKEYYDLQTEIGRGKFGTVYRCREKSSGLSLAAKFVSVTRKEDRRNVEREVDIMRSLQHPRLLQLYDAFEFEKNVCLILELIEGGELFERVIDDDFVLTEKACTIFMRQICEGIQFIHQQHILHLDLKPENILCLTKTGNRIKIIDFGLARRYEPGKRLQVLFGTPEFVAPEVVNFDHIGFNTDMWSIGVICYVLLSGLSPFMGDTDVETMANVTIAKYDFDDEVFEEISDDAKDFISMLLVKEKENRMCAEACLHHRWLRRKKPPPPPSQPTAKKQQQQQQKQEAQPPPPEVNNNNTTLEDRNNAVNKLEGTKDNLKNIVERWTEHPDSPYIFDTTAHTISPCPSLACVLGLGGDAQDKVGVPDLGADAQIKVGVPDLAGDVQVKAGVPDLGADAQDKVGVPDLEKDAQDKVGVPDLARDAQVKVGVPNLGAETQDKVSLPRLGEDAQDKVGVPAVQMKPKVSPAPPLAVAAVAAAPRDVPQPKKVVKDLAVSQAREDVLVDEALSQDLALHPLDPHARAVLGAERRASDSNCLVRLKNNHLDMHDRINLADEIRKLSDKLFRMASLSPLVSGDDIQSTTVTETRKGCTTTRTTFRSTAGAALSESFAAKAVQTQIPTRKFWPIEPRRLATASRLEAVSPAAPRAATPETPCPAAAAAPGRGRHSAHRRDSSASTTTTHSAPQSPRWSPDPELPPPPTSDLTKDMLLRLLHRLDATLDAGSEALSSPSPSPTPSSLLSDWDVDPFFRSRTTTSSLLDKKRTLITSHGGGV